MKTALLFLLASVVLLRPALATAQSRQIRFTQVDSVLLENAVDEEAPSLHLEENGFSSYYAGALRIWDTNGMFHSQKYYYGHTQKGLFNKKDSFQILSCTERGMFDNFLFIIYDNYFNIFTGERKRVYHGKFGETSWYIDQVDCLTNPGNILVFPAFDGMPHAYVGEKAKKVFLPLRYDYYVKRPFSKKEIARSGFYQYDSAQYDPSLPPLAVFDLSEIDFANLKPPENKYRAYQDEWRENLFPVKRKIGHVPDTFMRLFRNETKFFPHGRNIAFSVNEANETVFIQYLALPEIRAYDYEGEERAVFGMAGKYAKGKPPRLVAWDELKPESVTRFNRMFKERDAAYYVYIAWYLSPEYAQLYADSSNNLVYRVYRVPPKNERTHEELAALRAENDAAFWELYENKPTYLQIYDAANGYKLIYDEPVPAPFHIIGTDEDGFLWAVTGWNEDGVEVSKYKVAR